MDAVCGVVCGAGTHTCPATSGCFPDDDTLQCGTAASCQTCAPPADGNAEAVCTTNQCGTACKAGFHRCPAGTGNCVANTSVMLVRRHLLHRVPGASRERHRGV